jgi:hypothetical protein
MIELISERENRRRGVLRLALASVLYVTLTGCSGPAKPKVVTPTAPDPDSWRKQSLSISVEGYMFGGGTQPSAATWSGSGAWIGPNLAVTNAHVALRGLKITAKDE